MLRRRLNICAPKKMLIEPLHGVLSVPRPSWVNALGPKRLEMVGYFSKCSCLHCMRKKIQWIAGNFEILGQCS